MSPDLWTDERVLSLPWSAVPFYLGTISQADDAGRLEWSATQLAARIVGLREDVTLAHVRSWMAAIVDVGLVEVYSVEGRNYAHHPRWSRHQYVNRPQPSRIPEPQITERSVSDHGTISEAQVPPYPYPGPIESPNGLSSPSPADDGPDPFQPEKPARVPLTRLVAVYNDQRGTLPGCEIQPSKVAGLRTVFDDIRSALRKRGRDTDEDAVVRVWSAAVAAASRDDFYAEKRYGLRTVITHRDRWIGVALAPLATGNGRHKPDEEYEVIR